MQCTVVVVFVLFAVCVAVPLEGKPRCCAPEIYDAKFTTFVPTFRYQSIAHVNISYDYKNLRVASYAHLYTNPPLERPMNVHSIDFYKNRTGFDIMETAGRKVCCRAQMGANLPNDSCLPDRFKPVNSFIIGGGGKGRTSLKMTSWASFDEGELIVVNVAPGCVFAWCTENWKEPEHWQYLHSTFYNVTPGNKNVSIFVVPPECKHTLQHQIMQFIDDLNVPYSRARQVEMVKIMNEELSKNAEQFSAGCPSISAAHHREISCLIRLARKVEEIYKKITDLSNLLSDVF